VRVAKINGEYKVNPSVSELAGASLELIDKNQIFGPGDTINLQGFNAAGTETANLMT
jgi:hypothetical protein